MKLPRERTSSAREQPPMRRPLIRMHPRDGGGEDLEISREAGEREVARLEHARQPGELPIEVQPGAETDNRPVEQVHECVR